MIKSLKGAQVLVTRPAHQAENLSHLIEACGGVAVRFPTLAIAALDNSGEIDNTLTHLDGYQWLIFISTNAVTMHSYYSDDVKIKKIKSIRIVAIGKATAQALAMAGLPVDLVPESGYNSEALLAMPEMKDIAGQHYLIVRGKGGREELAVTLRSRGAIVEYLDVYKRIIPDIDSSQVSLLIAQDKLDVITITSGEALQNLLIMLAEKYHQRLFEVALVVVSNRIRQIAADLGFKRIAVTQSPSDMAILETVSMCVTGGIEWPN
ncbi:uroporphyrinogen-III synthase [Methylobacter sp. S3L5C]|uniref:uroporphyrinogen-III synthase n=1 Tax=Methylobacter sp. S3L5C TaxID=2839024 RepID=UPI001FAB6924|nr:uroporphyrinogen-III synthase [Methylobacter sp. S3L5C]UOA10278.1 uroporphyrinogen-III synthase [Methylobacter sp. S3L5C]